MEETKVFERALPNGVMYEIFESHGFSNNTELAIKIGGKIVSILVIQQKRTGNLVCNSIQSKRTFVEVTRAPGETPIKPLSLDDVAPVRPPEPEEHS